MTVSASPGTRQESSSEKRFISIFIDGASRGNPGEAGAGVVVQDERGRTFKKISRYLGRTTNNVAEYNALYDGLKFACSTGAKKIMVYSDSQLLIKQMRGEYRVKNKELIKLFQKIMSLIKEFDKILYTHIPREMNTEADFLANRAIDLRK